MSTTYIYKKVATRIAMVAALSMLLVQGPVAMPQGLGAAVRPPPPVADAATHVRSLSDSRAVVATVTANQPVQDFARSGLGRMGRDVWYVPDDFSTIQAAIDAASAGDTVRVRQGTYYESVLDFKGKAITVESTNGAYYTVIDAGSSYCVVKFNTNEGLDSVLEGFTLRNGIDSGIWCWAASPTIRSNVIEDNSGSNGAGIYSYHGSPLICDNIIWRNTADGYYGYGGGISVRYGSPVIQRNVIAENVSSSSGSGIYFNNGTALIEDNEIRDNSADGSGGGIFCGSDSTADIINNVITGNSSNYKGGGIWCDDDSVVTASGNTISGNSAYYDGGGIFCEGSTVIDDNLITENTASRNGGGVFCERGGAIVQNNTIDWNSASGFNGGGVYCKGTGSTIQDNDSIGFNSAGADGGGIWLVGGDHEIRENHIRFNTATGWGGGIWCENSLSTVTISKNVILSNSATGSDSCGGGISCTSASPVVEHNRLIGNTANAYGGGLDCDTTSSPTVNYNSFFGNHADSGGGISCRNESNPTVATNIFWDNRADSFGGGIYCGPLTEPVFTNDTLRDNEANFGGGICCDGGDTTLANMVLWDDAATSGGNEIYVDGNGYVRISYSDVEGGEDAAMVVFGYLFWRNGMIESDPLFKDPTPPWVIDFHLAPTSPCVNTGSNDAEGLTTYDIDGDPRIWTPALYLDPVVDMGADEYYMISEGPGGATRGNFKFKKPEYRYDDGSTENLLCWVDGGDMVGMHCFHTIPGGECLTEVGTIFGSVMYPNYAPGNGTPTDFYVWEATHSGDPTTCTLLAQGTGVVANVDTDIHWFDPLPCVVTTPYFWVGYNLHHGPFEYCLSIDESPYVTGTAFYTGTNTMYGFDPSNLYANQFPPTESSFGFWTVRASY